LARDRYDRRGTEVTLEEVERIGIEELYGGTE
jgi:hypothetical protein